MKIFRFQGKTVPPTNINARTRNDNHRRRSQYRHIVLDYEKWFEYVAELNIEEWQKEIEKYDKPIWLGIYLIRRTLVNFDLVEVHKTILHTLKQYGFFTDDNVSQVIPIHLGMHRERKDMNCGFMCTILPDSFKEEVNNVFGFDGNWDNQKWKAKKYRPYTRNKKKDNQGEDNP